MPKIYKGPIKKLYINFDLIIPGKKYLKYPKAEYVVKPDAEFYKVGSLFPKFISLDYDAVLASRQEAEEGNYPHVLFVDEEEIKPDREVSKQEFRAIKKQYRLKRKKS